MQSLFKNKVFRIIMVTDMIQQICIWIRNIAILFFVIESTNADPMAVSLITVMEYMPMFLFSYIGGTLADRWNPKKTMIFGDLFSAISIMIIFILIHMGLWQAVFAATFLSAFISQFSIPSSNVMFKRHIEENLVTPAISLSQSVQSLYIIIGPVIGTFIYGIMGLHFSLIMISALFAISCIVQFGLPNCKRKQLEMQDNMWIKMKEGFHYVYQLSSLRIISCIMLCLGLSQGLIQPLTIYILSDRLHLEAQSIQWFYSLSGLGLFVGAIVSSVVVNQVKTKIILCSGLLFYAAITIAEVLSSETALTAVLYFLSGTSVAFIQVAVSTPLIKNVSEEYIGRIGGLLTPLVTGGVIIGSGLSGVLVKQISLMPMFFISAAITLIGAMISLRFKQEENVEEIQCSNEMIS